MSMKNTVGKHAMFLSIAAALSGYVPKVIKEDMSIVTGSGTEEDPFIIEELRKQVNSTEHGNQVYEIITQDNRFC